jgi:2',3'-cyclic-nucleotide 2'-phosphodiesterase (5'-nucleotidase family)
MKLIFITLFLISCSVHRKNQKIHGHFELYSEPSSPKLLELEKDEKRVVIASTNDIGGRQNPSVISLEDQHYKGIQETKIGGFSVIHQYFNILRANYKNIILVDSGSLFSKETDIKEVKNFYKKNNYDAVTLGTSDFNLNHDRDVSIYVEEFGQKSNVPILLSNLLELKTARAIEWKGTKSQILKSIDGINIGMIGLIPDDIVTQSPVKNRVGLYVENMLQSTLRHARLLKSLGADMIIVMTHQSLDCSTHLMAEENLPRGKVNFDPHDQKACLLNNSLGDYLKRLPPQLVDVVVGGRGEDKIANFVNGVLVLGGFSKGNSLNFSEFVINTKTRKLNLEKTVVHQPVMFCHEFFKETNDCFTEDKTVNHKDRIKAQFLGTEINSEEIELH